MTTPISLHDHAGQHAAEALGRRSADVTKEGHQRADRTDHAEGHFAQRKPGTDGDRESENVAHRSVPGNGTGSELQ